MSLLLNRAKMTTATTGTGTVTLGSAVSPYQTFAAAGAVNGQTYAYLIEDGTAWEIGTGVYTSSGTTFSRSFTASSTGSAISLSGTATVGISARELDISPQLVQEVVTTGSQSNVTFSTIPTNFRHLEIVLNARGSTAATNLKVMCQFNADTGSNYQYQVNQSYSTGTSFSQSTGQTSAALGEITGSTATANYSGTIHALITNYQGTTFFKEGISCWGNTIGTSTFNVGAGNNGFAWANTAAITSVKVFPVSGNFVDNSIVSLYVRN